MFARVLNTFNVYPLSARVTFRWLIPPRQAGYLGRTTLVPTLTSLYNFYQLRNGGSCSTTHLLTKTFKEDTFQIVRIYGNCEQRRKGRGIWQMGVSNLRAALGIGIRVLST